MAEPEFEELRHILDRLPHHILAPTPFYSIVPNVSLEDDSPTNSGSVESSEDNADQRKDDNEHIHYDEPPEIASVTPTIRTANGERRRRKLPEIPKNKKSSILHFAQPISLADELANYSSHQPPRSQTYQGRSVLAFKPGYLFDEESSPDSEKFHSYGDVDSGHSTTHSPIDTCLKSFSPVHNGDSSPSSISGINFTGSGFSHSQLEMLEATHRGLHKFNPRHRDELEIDIGDPIYVQKEAEDLWCEGVNLKTGQQGIFPSAYAVDLEYNDFDPANANVKRERFLLGYLGSVETCARKGTEVICQAVKKINNDSKGAPRTQPCILEISDQGLRMVDRSKNVRPADAPCIDYFYSLKNVSFCAFHPRDHRYLGFITKHPTKERFACHIFRGHESTRPIAEALGRAFQRFYQKFIETAYPTEDIYIE